MPKILAIKPSSLGDIVHGLIVAQAIRDQVPSVHISWIAREIFAPLVTQSTAVDHVYVFRRHGGVFAFLRLMREVRRQRFDWVIDLQGLLRTGLMTALSRAPRKLGRRDYRELAGVFYRAMPDLPPRGPRSHAVDILLRFLPLMGLQERLPGPLTFRPAPPSGAPLDAFHRLSRPLVLFPGTRRAGKQWNGFAELTNFILLSDSRSPVVWAGDQPVAGHDSWPPHRFLNLTGRTPLAALPGIIGHASIVVGNDSGPTHLAAAMGRPAVAIFGPTDPDRFGPYPPRGRSNHVIRAPLRDLRRLSAREVFDALRKLPEWRALAARG